MCSRFIVTIGLAAGLATAIAIPAYSAKNHDHEHAKANPASSTSGVGGAESCETLLDMGCNVTASSMQQMMHQQNEINSAKALAVPRHVKRPQY